MYSLKQLVKSSVIAQRMLAVPLAIRRRWLVNKYRSAFEAMARLAALAQHDIRIAIPEFGAAFTINPRSALFQRFVIYGYYEPAVSSMFLRHIDPLRDVVDAGANIGFYTVAAARRLTSGRVLAIEPTASACRRLRINVADNGVTGKVIIEQCLLADAPGEMSVNVLDGQEEYASIGGLVHPGLVDRNSALETVPAVTLDSLVQKYQLKPALVKVDVEGAELKVLSGAVETLKAFRPYIMSECSDRMLSSQGASSIALRQLLVGLGYRVVNAESPATPLGRHIAGDIFCSPR